MEPIIAIKRIIPIIIKEYKNSVYKIEPIIIISLKYNILKLVVVSLKLFTKSLKKESI
jgi:hypothetical protein